MYKSGRGETSKRRGLLAIRREGVDDPRPLFTRVLPLFHYWPVEERQVGKGVTVTNCRKGDHDMPPLVNLIGFAPRLPMQSLLHDLSSLLPSPRPIFRFLSRNGARFLRTTGPPMVIWTGAALRKRIPIPRFLSFLLEELGRRTKETNEWRWSRFFDRDAVTMIRRNNGVENYQSSSPFPVQRFFRLRPAFFNALYVHALVTLKCRGSIFARLVQFPITRTLLVLEKARWSLSIAVHSARVIPSRPSFLFSLVHGPLHASFVSSSRDRDRECIERYASSRV